MTGFNSYSGPLYPVTRVIKTLGMSPGVICSDGQDSTADGSIENTVSLSGTCVRKLKSQTLLLRTKSDGPIMHKFASLPCFVGSAVQNSPQRPPSL